MWLWPMPKKESPCYKAEHRCSRFGHHRKYGLFTPEELPNNKYYIFGKQGAKLAADKNVPLGALPLVQSVREAADVGRPAALRQRHPYSNPSPRSSNLVTQLLKRNTTLPPTKAVAITNMVGCALKKSKWTHNK